MKLMNILLSREKIEYSLKDLATPTGKIINLTLAALVLL